jgi:hypothetical protein
MGSLDRRCLSLAAAECANYLKSANSKKDYCIAEWTEDHRCIFATTDDARCGYFEECVLLLDRELQAMFLADRTARAAGDTIKPDTLRRVGAAAREEIPCLKCGKPFSPRSNRQKVCPSCRAQIGREKQRAYRQRQKGPTVTVRA